MTANEVNKTLDDYHNLEKTVRKIIDETYDDFIVGVNSIDFDDEARTKLWVNYEYRCRGWYDNADCYFPVKWLEEGFDYKAAYADLIEKKRKEQENAEKLAKEQEEKAKEKKERAEYERLKKKFEGE